MPDKFSTDKNPPNVSVPHLDGGKLRFDKPIDEYDRQMLVVYRGKDCSICKTYLPELQRTILEFPRSGIGVISDYGGPERHAHAFAGEIGVMYPVGYGLTVDQMGRSAPTSRNRTRRRKPIAPSPKGEHS